MPGIEKWIDDNMNYRSCVVVLIGEETANRKWVKHRNSKSMEGQERISWNSYSQSKRP